MRRKSSLIKTYPDEALLEEVRRVAGLVEEPVLTHADFTKHSGIPANALIRRFGGWRATLERAGLAHLCSGGPAEKRKRGSRQTYTDEEALAEVRRVAQVVGRPTLTARDFERHSEFGLNIFKRRFGSWKAVLESAGLHHMRSRRLAGPRPPADILDLIRQFAAETDRDSFMLKVFSAKTGISSWDIKHHFGGWKEAVIAAGLSYQAPAMYSQEKCMANVANLWAYYGQPPTYGEVDGPLSSVSASVYNTRWGGLRKAFEEFLEWIDSPAARQYVAESESSDAGFALRFLAMKRDSFRCVVCGRGPAGRDGVELHADHVSFESEGMEIENLRTLCDQCEPGKAADGALRIGLDTGSAEAKTCFSRRCPDEVLLDEVRRVAKLVGKPVLMHQEFCEHAGNVHSTYRRRFGKWKDVLERAGLGHMYCGRGSTEYVEDYPEEVLLEEVRRVANLVSGPVLTKADFAEHSRINARALVRQLGGWRAALERAGVGHLHSGEADGWPNKYTDEVLLEEVRRVAALVGRPTLTRDDFDKHSEIPSYTVGRRFGKWRAVLERAGLGHMYSAEVKGSDNSVRYDDADLLEEIRRVAGLVEKASLTQADFDGRSSTSTGTIVARLGSWREALKRAGLGHMYSRATEVPEGLAYARYSDEMLLEEVRRVAKLVGKPVLVRVDFQRHSKISFSTVTRRLGGWKAALDRAGLGNMHSGSCGSRCFKYSREAILEEIRRVAGLTKKPGLLTTADFESNSTISLQAVINRYGHWRDALEQAGVGQMYINRKEAANNYSDEELLSEVRRVAELVANPVLMHSDFISHSTISAEALRLRLGRWSAVLEKAGVGHLNPHKSMTRFTDEELLDEVRRAARLVGERKLTQADFTRISSASITTMTRRFGNWSAVLERAGVGGGSSMK